MEVYVDGVVELCHLVVQALIDQLSEARRGLLLLEVECQSIPKNKKQQNKSN